VAVSSQQVLTPLGRLDPAIVWPGLSLENVDQKIRAFIQDGSERVAEVDAESQDEAVKIWVYYRAKDEQYNRMVGMPSTVADSDEGSSSYLLTQIQMVKDDRDALLEEFEDLLVTAGVEEEEEYGTITSYRD
jgi:hypothetical protein